MVETEDTALKVNAEEGVIRGKTVHRKDGKITKIERVRAKLEGLPGHVKQGEKD
jgi:hypothetical protein